MDDVIMSEDVTLQIDKALGYGRGRQAKPSYIARIVGTSDQYIFDRQFVSTVPIDRAEYFNARRKNRGSWREEATVGVGLYEVQSHGEKTYCVVLSSADGGMRAEKISEERAVAIAVRLEEGADLISAISFTNE